uniref:MD-2-related lipid-recognition domain-containing protein n=1 Tax=Chlamydomonas leiostraca TaxID=1034604 RepID=A0A7S0S7V9_9CHLO|mmetsp:Transcript_9866/g.24636  ORF Transcript_9866/g.24636 Transcript_9866/m.24636 type:complete len:184 (+) Transcript_9866:56-607(+)|eukprot:CAMPEP_0202865988 /NCGR_PEP_ID=MMETSP1391-20130828/6888_1 /ASSEMBLY_ACC=CAM_ASM_000867 /TAXON_ID=1034604 /ORGANISM="Chlamydomonas leiostraca, Strain SAG 11-49" /LENGTH=183 /DNA_ID=CAMNT_0049545885 /DNA_START=35 /DNA_END=586 /DNA_ORIENTATION=-
MEVKNAVISIALVALLPLVACHPSYWARTYRTAASGKCTEHPQFGYGPHSQRVFDDKATSYALSMDGQPKAELCPGTAYNLEVTFKSRRELLITSSAGMIKPTKDGNSDCPNRVVINDVLNGASFTLTAPCHIPEGGVKVEVTSADFSDLNYKYSSVTFHKGDVCGPLPAHCPAAAAEGGHEF